jgi:hypothetical protein
MEKRKQKPKKRERKRVKKRKSRLDILEQKYVKLALKELSLSDKMNEEAMRLEKKRKVNYVI